MTSLKELPSQSTLLWKEDPAIESYAQDTVMRGLPDAVLRARDIQEIQEALAFCHAHKIPVTFCGSQTSETGASVALGGLLISTENLEKVLDVGAKDGKAYAKAEPGITISNLKKAVALEGWFYPPAPTSQDDARLGATISTNATGEDSLQYGTTRKYIREIKVLLANGSQKIFSRKKGEIQHDELNRAGYFLESKNPIDFFIGGEGTLGFIYEATVDLVPEPPGFFAALAPFPDNKKAIDFVAQTMISGKFKPRAMELIDEGALLYMQTHPTFPKSLKEAKALIYFKQEYLDEMELNVLLEKWLAQIEKFSTPSLAAEVLLATTPKQKEEMRLWRHQIPLKLNETWRHFWNQGGGKVGTDWWVPVNKIQEMMTYVYQTAPELKIPFFAFGHIGQGHPHIDYLCKNAEEKKRAAAHQLQCSQRAVSLGGGVAGEHGIGKIYHHLLALQWPSEKIAQMARIKKEWDPNWILGRGNILVNPVHAEYLSPAP